MHKKMVNEHLEAGDMVKLWSWSMRLDTTAFGKSAGR